MPTIYNVRITNKKLKKIIKEELNILLNEIVDMGSFKKINPLSDVAATQKAHLEGDILADPEAEEEFLSKLRIAAILKRGAEEPGISTRRSLDIPDPRGGRPKKGLATFPAYDEVPVEEIPVGTDPFEFLEIE